MNRTNFHPQADYRAAWAYILRQPAAGDDGRTIGELLLDERSPANIARLADSGIRPPYRTFFRHFRTLDQRQSFVLVYVGHPHLTAALARSNAWTAKRFKLALANSPNVQWRKMKRGRAKGLRGVFIDPEWAMDPEILGGNTHTDEWPAAEPRTASAGQDCDRSTTRLNHFT